MLKTVIIKPVVTDIRHINTLDKYSFSLVYSMLTTQFWKNIRYHIKLI